MENDPTKETYTHEKRPTIETNEDEKRPTNASWGPPHESWYAPEMLKRDLQKRPTIETYNRDL